MHVYCTTRFTAMHAWDDAPDEVAFLRSPHRHEFHVRLSVEVDHDDRDIEFIMLKRALDGFIAARILGTDRSCEQYASAIRDHFAEQYPGRAITVDVSEDGENGAIVTTDGTDAEVAA